MRAGMPIWLSPGTERNGRTGQRAGGLGVASAQAGRAQRGKTDAEPEYQNTSHHFFLRHPLELTQRRSTVTILDLPPLDSHQPYLTPASAYRHPPRRILSWRVSHHSTPEIWQQQSIKDLPSTTVGDKGIEHIQRRREPIRLKFGYSASRYIQHFLSISALFALL